MNSRVIQDRATRIDLVLKLRMGGPEQSHGAGNVRSCHGRAAKINVRIIGAVKGRAIEHTRSGNIRLYQVTSIDGTRAPTAKRSNDIGAGDQGSDRICGLINPGRV